MEKTEFTAMVQVKSDECELGERLLNEAVKHMDVSSDEEESVSDAPQISA